MTDASTPEDGSLNNTDTPDLMTPALGYARNGWPVLRCRPGDKIPAMKDWPTTASTDFDTVRDWWVQWPDANIGLATGRRAGFFVLDIDPKHGGDEELAMLQAQHGGLPRTRTVRTPSGGTHYYFEMPDFEVTNSPGDLKGTGIDVRGEGGQVLAPPSTTPEGVYRLILDAPIVPAPGWLLDLIRPKLRVVKGDAEVPRIQPDDFDRQRAYALNVALPAAARAVAAAPEGERNQTLNNQVLALAGIAAHDERLLTYGDVDGAMSRACPLPAEEYVATFQSAWSAGLSKPRLDWPPRDRNEGLSLDGWDDLPTVQLDGRKHNEEVDEIFANLAAGNATDPQLFLLGDVMVEVKGNGTRPVTKASLRYVADRYMHFVRAMPKGGDKVVKLEKDTAETCIDRSGDAGLPPLTRVAHAPFFSPSGRLVLEEGYDAESQTYLRLGGLQMPPLPSVTTARTLLLDEVLGDFPWASEADKAHAVALVLLPFVRDMIDGATPLHNIEAPTPGSGKGLLARVALLPGCGRRYTTWGAASTNEEWEKRLVTFLRSSPEALVMDNVNEKVTSGFLCTALTEPVVSARQMGGNSVVVEVPVRCAWVMTANNPRFSDEVARRTVRVRLDAGVEHPEDRSGFRHERLEEWATDHRADLVAACCALVQSWIEAGAPRPVLGSPFGSFEAWHATMAGLLEHIGVPGLLGNKAEFVAASDEETHAWAQLVEVLEHSVDSDWSASVIASLVADNGIPIDLGSGSDRALMMGRQLSRQRDRWHGGARFEAKKVKGLTRWYLVRRPNL